MKEFRSFAQFALALALSVVVIPDAQSQEVYPPTGERLRDLAERHGFQIGYASRYKFTEQDQSERYQHVVSQEFNIATSENSVKWEYVHPQPGVYDFTDMDRLAAFAEQHSMVLHGHPLLWHNQNPQWLDGLNATQVEAVMIEHITEVVSRYAGKIDVWDVVNEGLNDPQSDQDTKADISLRPSIWYNAMGEPYISKAFEAARAADPSATLIYNEYDIGWYNAKSHAMYDLVSDMVATGVPLDGVGLQMHLNHTFNHYEDFSDNMQRYADLGLDIYLTEFDVRVLQPEDYDQQGVVYEGVLRRCLLQPRCKALQIWGVDDLHSWQPYFDPLPFDDFFNIKPAYYGMQRALLTQPLHVEQFSEASKLSVSSGAVQPSATDAWLKMPGISFDPLYQSVALRYKKTTPTVAMLELRLDGTQGPLLATINLSATGAGSAQTSEQLLPIAGKHDVFVIFKGDSSGLSLDGLLLEDPKVTSLPESLPDSSPDSSQSTLPANGSASDGAAAGFSGPTIMLALLAMLGLRRRFFVPRAIH